VFEDPSLRPVTCMKTSGRCVTTGHNNGDVFLWSYNNYVKVTSHKKCVTDLGVMVYSGEYSSLVFYYAFLHKVDKRCVRSVCR
jgi:hypothetical protein